MSLRKTLMLVLALFVGVMTYLSFRSSQAPAPGTPAQVIETTQVLAAARDLPTGTILKDTDMKWIPWSENAENSKLYLKGKVELSGLTGAVLREGLHADEPFLMGRVVQPHEQGFLAAVLSPGTRAISISLTPSAEVAGFIFPGDHVDVILTHPFVVKGEGRDGTTSDRRLSEILIKDARVLALDQKSDNQSTDPKIAQIATLEVTPKQAEKMALAADMVGAGQTGISNRGTLSLVLRSLANDDNAAANAAVPTDQGVTMDNDISPAYVRVMQTAKVQVMRGKDVTETILPKQK